jgi:hypothetical protein
MELDYSCSLPELTWAEGGNFVSLRFARSQAAQWNAELWGSWERTAKRGKCKGFTYGSRRRMMRTLNGVSKAAPLPVFVTLTFPDNCFMESVTEFAKEAKGYLDIFLKRLRRVCPSAGTVWKMEWQSRKSGVYEGKLFPHFHLLVFGVERREEVRHTKDGSEPFNVSFVRVRDDQLSFGILDFLSEDSSAGAGGGEGRRARDVDIKVDGVLGSYHFRDSLSYKIYRRVCERVLLPGEDIMGFMSLRDWVAVSWYDVVGTGNPDHFVAGTRVEEIRSWGGVLAYAAKYMSKVDAEMFLRGVCVGRSWGISNREAIPWAKIIKLDLDDDMGVRLRRIARRYLEHVLDRKWKAPYGITVYCNPSHFVKYLKICRPPPDPF